jgi:steroid delta-isomerase-like uncharacterized protein
MTTSRPQTTTIMRALVVAYYEALTGGRLEGLDSLLDDDFVEHELVAGLPPTRDGLKHKYTMLRGGFADLRFSPEDILPYGDRIAVRVTVRGTHYGDFMGRPPTGRSFEVTSVGVFRIAGERIVEHWGVFDQMAMLAQLGAMGAPG